MTGIVNIKNVIIFTVSFIWQKGNTNKKFENFNIINFMANLKIMKY